MQGLLQDNPQTYNRNRRMRKHRKDRLLMGNHNPKRPARKECRARLLLTVAILRSGQWGNRNSRIILFPLKKAERFCLAVPLRKIITTT